MTDMDVTQGCPVPDPAKTFEEQEPLTILAMLIWGEARGEAHDGKVAVGCVVRNRVGQQPRYGRGFAGVCLKPYQFSCFLSGDPNSKKLLRPLDYEPLAVWQDCYQAAAEVYWGEAVDPTRGAVFYHDARLLEPPTAWGEVELTVIIGRLKFYREVRRG